MSAQQILEALACGKAQCACGRSARDQHGLTHCPAHPDDRPSLDVKVAKSGRLLVRCHASCSQTSVVDELRSRGLWPARPRSQRQIVATYPYVDMLERLLYEVVRFEPKDFRQRRPGRDGGWVWSLKGVERVLYRLPEVVRAVKDGRRIFITEGEKDADALRGLGRPWRGMDDATGGPNPDDVADRQRLICATTNPGGAGKWNDSYSRVFFGTVSEIVVTTDKDEAGRRHAQQVAASIHAVVTTFKDRNATVKVLEFPGQEVKDAADWVAARGTREELDRLVDATESWTPLNPLDGARSLRENEAARAAEAASALAASAGLLDDPDLLRQVERYIAQSGYAGDTTAPRIVYLALTSRCLRRPINLGIIAASASGKNTAIDVVLPLFPDSAYVLVKASSARALVYGSDDFEHKTLIVAEADSIPDEGPAASAVRSVAADNSMTYEVVERDEKTGKWGTRKIVKPGPTGLITTSTKGLGEQMGTRMLEIGLVDTAEQTRAVMRAHAAAVNGKLVIPDPARYAAAQRWLELAGVRDIVIPFAGALADLVPPDLIRMRRDFRQLLTAIETVAFLRQRQRTRDERDRIVATLGDYRDVRELLADVFTATASGGVTSTVREVVGIVQQLAPAMPNGVPIAAIASKLAPPTHIRTVQRRVRNAVRLGHLVQADARKGQALKILPGNDLPEKRDALPTAEEFACEYHPEVAVAVSWTLEEPTTTGVGTATAPCVAPLSHDIPGDGETTRGSGATDASVAVTEPSLLTDTEAVTPRQPDPGDDARPLEVMSRAPADMGIVEVEL